MENISAQTRSLDERIKRASEFTIQDKYLIRYFLSYFGNLKAQDLGKGYSKEVNEKRFDTIFSVLNITEDEEKESITVYKLMNKLDRELAGMNDPKTATDLISIITAFFIGYPYNDHKVDPYLVKGREMEIIAGYVRLSAKNTLTEYKRIGGKYAEIMLTYFLSRDSGIKIHRNDDIGTMLYRAYSLAMDEFESSTRRDINDDNNALFYEKSRDARRAYLIVKNLMIDPIREFHNNDNTDDIFIKKLG